MITQENCECIYLCLLLKAMDQHTAQFLFLAVSLYAKRLCHVTKTRNFAKALPQMNQSNESTKCWTSFICAYFYIRMPNYLYFKLLW